jgi:hypothetical protein
MKINDKIKQFNQNKNSSITKLLDGKIKYRIDFFTDGKKKYMGIFNNKKLVIAGNYNFFGIFQPSTKLWIWASSIPGVNINHIKNINKLRTFSYLFESDSNIKSNFYYQLLTQDVVQISNDEMLNWINDLILYLSNDIYYFNPFNSDGNMQFLTLSSIREKYI